MTHCTFMKSKFDYLSLSSMLVSHLFKMSEGIVYYFLFAITITTCLDYKFFYCVCLMLKEISPTYSLIYSTDTHTPQSLTHTLSCSLFSVLLWHLLVTESTSCIVYYTYSILYCIIIANKLNNLILPLNFNYRGWKWLKPRGPAQYPGKR